MGRFSEKAVTASTLGFARAVRTCPPRRRFGNCWSVGITADTTCPPWKVAGDGVPLAALAPHGEGFRQVTLKIETASDGQTATLRLIGRIDAQYLDQLRAEVMKHQPRLVLDLDEVALVDVAVVRFLISCEADGIELRHCAPYIREWMTTERGREQ
jgi:hypothetical protein